MKNKIFYLITLLTCIELKTTEINSSFLSIISRCRKGSFHDETAMYSPNSLSTNKSSLNITYKEKEDFKFGGETLFDPNNNNKNNNESLFKSKEEKKPLKQDTRCSKNVNKFQQDSDGYLIPIITSNIAKRLLKKNKQNINPFEDPKKIIILEGKKIFKNSEEPKKKKTREEKFLKTFQSFIEEIYNSEYPDPENILKVKSKIIKFFKKIKIIHLDKEVNLEDLLEELLINSENQEIKDKIYDIFYNEFYDILPKLKLLKDLKELYKNFEAEYLLAEDDDSDEEEN